MITQGRVLAVMPQSGRVHVVHVWLAVSQAYNLSIRLVPREGLFKVIEQMAEDGFMALHQTDAGSVELELTERGRRTKPLSDQRAFSFF